MRNIPDQREDDTLFAKLFGEWGDQTAMARLMGISPTTFRRMLDPDDADHPSDLHRAKRLLFAAAHMEDAAKGEAVWAEMEAVMVRSRRLAPLRVERFPSKAVFNLADRELNFEEIERVPMAERLAALNEVINLLVSYRDGLVFEGVEDSPDESDEGGPERADLRDVSTRRPATGTRG